MRNGLHCCLNYINFGQHCALQFWKYSIVPGAGEKSLVLTYEILPCIAGNLLHLEGRPGLMPRYSPGMGVRGFPLTSALLWNIKIKICICVPATAENIA